MKIISPGAIALLALFIGSLFIGSLAPAASADKVDIAVQSVLANTDPADTVSIIVRLADKVDIPALRREFAAELQLRFPDGKVPRKHRKAMKRLLLNERLKDRSRISSMRVEQFLERNGAGSRLERLWAINAVSGEVPVWLVERLANLPVVESIALNATLQGPTTNSVPTAPTNWNLDMIAVPGLWQIGHTGLNVVVATMDTGVDITHPDLWPGYRGGSNSWFDAYGQHSSPADISGHGTQVLGLMVGGDSSGFQIGIAPDAKWIAARIFDNANQATLSAIHAAYQWMLDPDGDPATDDSPDIVNNSWALSGTVGVCDQEFSEDLAILREGEIAVVFSAGNFGPDSNTSVSPANDTSVLAAGAIDSLLRIATASSRGAGACDGGIYPHIVAPGVDILTLDLIPQSFNVVSGTSFASAHLSGGMAILKGAFPDATVSQLETALVDSALDLGSPGPDQEFGHGLLDLVGAYNWLVDNVGGEYTPPLPQPGQIQLESANYSVSEGVASLAIGVTRTGGSDGSVSIGYATSDGSATAGTDYLATSGTLTFLEGEVLLSFSVPLIDDVVFEGDENFSITISGPSGGATIGSPDTGIATIVDDDPDDTEPPEPQLLTITMAECTRRENGRCDWRFEGTKNTGATQRLSIEIGNCSGLRLGATPANIGDGPWVVTKSNSDRNLSLAPIAVCVPGSGNIANLLGIVPTEAGAGPNQPPIAIDDPNETAFTGGTIAIDVLANDSDPEGQPLSIVNVDTAGTAGTATCSSSSCSYTAAGVGSDTFMYTISDGDPTSADATAMVTVTVSVAPPNSAPVATDNAYGISTASILIGNAITDDTGSGVDSDADGDPLTAIQVGPNPAGAASFTLNADGSFSYQSTAGFSGTATFQYVANDGTDDSNTAMVSIEVTAPSGMLTITSAVCTRRGNGRCDWRFEGTKNTGTIQRLSVEIGNCSGLRLGATPASIGDGPWVVTKSNSNRNLGLDPIAVCVPGSGNIANLLGIVPTEQ